MVPGKLFSEIVKNLPDAAVHVEATDDQAFVTCDTSSFSIRALNAEDFPGFPRVDVHQKIEIPFHQFSTMVKRVSRVVSKDESRAILTGVLITLEAGVLRMVATDSYRLAITDAPLPNSSADEFHAVISGSFLSGNRVSAENGVAGVSGLGRQSDRRDLRGHGVYQPAALKATSPITSSCFPTATLLAPPSRWISSWPASVVPRCSAPPPRPCASI